MKLGRVLVGIAALGAVAAGAVAVAGPVSNKLNPQNVSYNQPAAKKGTPDKDLHFSLGLSSDALKKCFPHAKANVSVALKTDEIGKDIIKIDVSGLPANVSFTAFFLELPKAPFGAAEYFGDVNTDKYGKGHGEFQLIVQEAFASTLVNGKRVRVDLNQMGMWFADPKDDEGCLKGSAPTPFDGDDDAGVQIFNSANLRVAPLPAP